jgi:hypothetical protein
MSISEADLTAYLDGELSEGERQRVERALAASPQLRRQLDELRREAETVKRALDRLAMGETGVAPRPALERLRSHLDAAAGGTPSSEDVTGDAQIVEVWESPPLWAEIKTGLKSLTGKRSDNVEGATHRSRQALAVGVILLIPLITVAVVVWLNAIPQPLGALRLGGGPAGGATPAPANPELRRGIQADPLGDMEANIERIKAMGLEWVKFQMAWKSVGTSQGSYQWGDWDALITAYADQGIQVLLSIPKAPDWARPADDDKSVEGLPADPALYAQFVAQVAGRYRGQVQAIEIWDEENMWYKAGGAGRVEAEAYGSLLQQAYQAIKAANQNMIVVSGGMTPADTASNADGQVLAVNDVDYLEQLYAAGFGDAFDALGAHAPGYNCPALADWQTVEDDTASFRAPFETRHPSWCFLGPLQAYREVMLAHGDGDKPIWVTEFGWAVADNPQQGYDYAADNTPQEQAEWIVDAYRWAESQDWVGAMFLWNLDYSQTAPGIALGYFSIVDTPAYQALVQMSRAEDKEK